MILSIDCGSTNHKVALFDEDLRRLSSRSTLVRYSVNKQETVEFDPAEFWQDTVSLIRHTCADVGVLPRDVRTISIASQAQTFTLIDPAGDPLVPFLSWADRRATVESEELAHQFGSEFHQHCSFPSPIPQLQISKLLWISHRISAQARATARIVSLPTFLAIKLAGLHCIDTNLAAMSGIFSLLTNTWWSAALSLCGLSPQACGQAVQIGTSVAAQASCPALELSPELRIVFAGNDQTAGAFASSLRSDGAILTLGTALAAYRFAGSAPGPFNEKGCWGPYPRNSYYELVTCENGCAALDWAVQELTSGDREKFLQLAWEAPPGKAIFYPHLSGTAAPWRGSQTTPSRALAVLEGICFEFRELLEQFPDQGFGPVTATGGGSASDQWLQLLAHVLNRPVRRSCGDVLRGAAMLAAPDIQAPEPAGVREFMPNSSQAREYSDVYDAWRNRKHANGRAVKKETSESPLTYRDTKSVGAADFYLAINATFRFIEKRLGKKGLVQYWEGLGTSYYAPVASAWKKGGLAAVSEYWNAFFKAEPGADVQVNTTPEQVRLEVRVCPAITHLRENGREIVPCFCQHCYYVSDAIGKLAGITVRLKGGNGSCEQTFAFISADQTPQDFANIQEAK